MIVWLLVAGFLGGIALAFTIGANDVANSFGTSVGSNVLTLRRACVLASIFETSGAILLGARYDENSFTKGVVDLSSFNDDVSSLEYGLLSCLIGAFSWLLVATLFKLPVSGTHSVVGAVIGFTIVAKGGEGVNWIAFFKLVSSWFISPVMSGIISAAIYFFLQAQFLRIPGHSQQLETGLQLLPVIYALTFAINSFAIVYDGPRMLYLNYIPFWGAILISAAIGVLAGVVAKWIVAPKLGRKIRERETLPTRDSVDESIQGRTPPPSPNPDQASNPLLTKPKLMVDHQTSVNEADLISSTNHNSAPQLTTQLTPPSLRDASNSFVGSARFASRSIAASNASMLNAIAEAQHEHDEAEHAAEQYHGRTESECYSTIGGTLETLSGPPVTSTPFHSSHQLIKPFVPPKKYNSDQREEANKTRNSADENNSNRSARHRPTIYELFTTSPAEIEYHGVFELFTFLQIFTACFSAFVHGGNDVMNAIGPVVGMYSIYEHRWPLKHDEQTEMWILALGGTGLSLGLWVLGRRVIETVGTDLTEVTPPSGFSIELGAATTFLIANYAQVPISTTHCKIGSVILVGISRGGREQVNWKIFQYIILAWLVTVPVAGVVSATIMRLLLTVLKSHPHDEVSLLLTANMTNMTTIWETTTLLDQF